MHLCCSLLHSSRATFTLSSRCSPMNARQVTTMTFYFARPGLPFYPQNVSRDPITRSSAAPREREREREREAYENVTPSSLSSPCRYSDVVSHFSSSLCLATRVYFQAQPHRAGDATRKREDDRRERSLSLACAGRSNRWNALTCGLPRCVNHS